jgi:hypothetical protein
MLAPILEARLSLMLEAISVMALQSGVESPMLIS